MRNKKELPKATDKVKEWMKDNCIKGEILNITSTSQTLIIERLSYINIIEYTNGKNKKK